MRSAPCFAAARTLAIFIHFFTPILLATSDAVPNEWIVTRDGRLPWKDIESTFADEAHFIRSFGSHDQFAVFKSRSGRLKEKDPAGFSVQPNFVYSSLDGDDPDFEKCWGLRNDGSSPGKDYVAGVPGVDIGATEAWKLHTGTGTVVVALTDSGLDFSHVEFQRNIWNNPSEIADNNIDDDHNGFVDDVRGWNFVSHDNQPFDDNGHGTFCAGIIGAEARNNHGSRGIVWNVKIMPVKFLDNYGLGTTADAVSAIEYAVNNGADIINASWGGTKFDQVLYDTIKWAGQKGVLFVAASGNSGENNDESPQPTFPASYRLKNIISVAAYNNRDELWSMSNYGKETVDIGAPGVGIYSTVPGGYRMGDGSSYSTAFVTGVAALLKSFVPHLTLVELKDRLISTSEVIHYYEKEHTRSAGRIHAGNALADIRPPRPKSPSQWFAVSQTLSSLHPYPASGNNTWEIRHPGATHIRLRFSKFQTESCCDIVSLYDGSGKLIARYSGAKEDLVTADALGDTLILKFHSDSSHQEYGFDILSYEVSFD